MNLMKLRELWDSGIPVRDIAAQLNTNISTVYELRVMHQLKPRRRSGSVTPDPTPDEISEAAAAIRAKWSPARLAEASVIAWTPPKV